MGVAEVLRHQGEVVQAEGDVEVVVRRWRGRVQPAAMPGQPAR